LNPDHRSPYGDRLGLKIKIGPAQRRALADTKARGQHHRYEIREITFDGLVVVCEQGPELACLSRRQRPRLPPPYTARNRAHVTNRIPLERVVAAASPHIPERTDRHILAVE